MMFLRKEHMKSMIFTKQREFGLRAVQMLNAAAFPAEKFTVADVAEKRDSFFKKTRQSGTSLSTAPKVPVKN